MRDATYVVIALALCSLGALFLSEQKPAPIWLLDLADFRHLPIELKSALRRMLPDPDTIRQKWVSMTPDQKRGAIQQLTGGCMPPQHRPTPPAHHSMGGTGPAVYTPPRPVVEAPVVEVTPEPVETASPLKSGFLNPVQKGKKKDTKKKKGDEVVALSAVGADVDGSAGDTGSFLSVDQ